MSRHSFRGGTTQTLAELEIDLSRVHGNGGTEYPRLYWQFELVLQPPRTPPNDYAFRVIEAQLYLPNGQKIAESRPIMLKALVRSHQAHAITEFPSFEFPLDMHRIGALEGHWQSGRLKLRLDMQLSVEEHGVIEPHVETKRPALWGLRNVYQLSLQEDLQIPRSHWVEHVLPSLGYGKVHVLEFPAVPLESCAALGHSFKALQQAVEKHRLGFYDDAVGKCRMALEPFFDQVPVDPTHPDSRRIPVLKKTWETRLGKASYQWLNETLGALKDASNRPHHSPNSHYSQFDSQMILAIATAVTAYVAREADIKEGTK